MTAAGAIAVDAGELPLGGGLLALVRPALARLAPGGVLVVRAQAPSVRDDLPAWCRIEHHAYLGCEREDGADRHLIARGPLGPVLPAAAPRLTARDDGTLWAVDLAAVSPLPETADPATGFAPRGAVVEAGGPAWPFRLTARDRVAPPEVAELYDQATQAQWDAARDVPWRSVRPLGAALDGAVAQVMTFLAENELSALYVPARFLPRVHPAFVETAQLLAIQLADEARHIDVFRKRAQLAGAPAVSAAVTASSLRSLLDPEDFTEAAFLLAVLGEGTFLDLLRFVETHAPDDATAELARRARVDEARHVRFGLAHVRHAMQRDPGVAARLEAAVRRRAATLAGVGGVPAPVADALTLLAAHDTAPRAIARGHEAFRALLETMHENRKKRLEHAGFAPEDAERLSALHTPNFM